MNRRAFIGLLTAPMIVRATSLDALPRGVPLSPAIEKLRVGVYEFCGVDFSKTPDGYAAYQVWFDGEMLKTRTIPQTEFYQTVSA